MCSSWILPEWLTGLQSTERDRQVAVTSIRQARKVMAAKALVKYRAKEGLPEPGYETDAALLKKAGDIATTIIHPAGT